MAQLSLTTDSHTLDGLSKKYEDFFVPCFKIEINGTDITTQVGVTQLRVDTTIEHTADSFTFRVAMPHDLETGQETWPGSIELGATIDISLGYAEKYTPVFTGYITSITGDYPETETPGLIVRGMDMSFLMMRGAKHKTWTKKKYSQIVKEIAGTHKVTTSHVDETTVELPVVVQSGVSDYHFIQQMAKLVGYDFFIVGKNLYFRKPSTQTTPVITLERGVGLRSVSIDANIAEQLTDVHVVAWDAKEQKLLKGTSAAITKIGNHPKTGKDLLSKLGTYEETVYSNAISQDEAKSYATAHLQRQSMQLVTGTGECIGIPEIRAGRYIKFDKLNAKLNGLYYLSAVTHVIDDDGYVTRFQLRGNAVT